MKAVVFHAAGDVRVEEVPVPSNSASEILVKVDACAVCGSDLKAAAVGNSRIAPPRVMGHEFTGVITAVGANVRAPHKVGDRIVMATSIGCGTCYYCSRGQSNLCTKLAPMGFSYDGGMASHVVIPEKAIVNGNLVTVPDGIAPDHAALAEPLSCAVNSVEKCDITPESTVVVVGNGPLGLLNAFVAAEAGAKNVIIVGRNKKRVAFCRELGFARVVSVPEESPKDVIMDITGGLGADSVIVTAPEAAPQEEALGMVRKQGRVVLFASLPVGKNMLTLDSRLIHYNEIQVVGCSDSTAAQVRRSLELIKAGRFPFGKIVTHTLPLDGIHDAFALMRAGDAMRVVLKP